MGTRTVDNDVTVDRSLHYAIYTSAMVLIKEGATYPYIWLLCIYVCTKNKIGHPGFPNTQASLKASMKEARRASLVSLFK